MATEKTIAALWCNLQKEEAKAINHWKRFEKTQSDSSLIWHTKAKANVLILRQQLLDRISDAIRDDCAIGSVARIRFVEEDDMDYIERQMVEVETGNVWAAEAPKLRELACAILFMAWELEQMKGKQNGN